MEIKDYQQFAEVYQIFTGFLSSDPKVKYFESGACKVTFSIPLKKKKEDEATWLNCEIWGKKGERLAEEYKKGDEITVAGVFRETLYNNKTYTNLIVRIYC